MLKILSRKSNLSFKTSSTVKNILLYDSERGGDEPDAMVGDGQHVSERVKSLARGLQRDIARIITFSNEDLHVRDFYYSTYHA